MNHIDAYQITSYTIATVNNDCTIKVRLLSEVTLSSRDRISNLSYRMQSNMHRYTTRILINPYPVTIISRW